MLWLLSQLIHALDQTMVASPYYVSYYAHARPHSGGAVVGDPIGGSPRGVWWSTSAKLHGY
jgi:hypothetical protein